MRNEPRCCYDSVHVHTSSIAQNSDTGGSVRAVRFSVASGARMSEITLSDSLSWSAQSWPGFDAVPAEDGSYTFVTPPLTTSCLIDACLDREACVIQAAARGRAARGAAQRREQQAHAWHKSARFATALAGAGTVLAVILAGRMVQTSVPASAPPLLPPAPPPCMLLLPPDYDAVDKDGVAISVTSKLLSHLWACVAAFLFAIAWCASSETAMEPPVAGSGLASDGSSGLASDISSGLASDGSSGLATDSSSGLATDSSSAETKAFVADKGAGGRRGRTKSAILPEIGAAHAGAFPTPRVVPPAAGCATRESILRSAHFAASTAGIAALSYPAFRAHCKGRRAHAAVNGGR